MRLKTTVIQPSECTNTNVQKTLGKTKLAFPEHTMGHVKFAGSLHRDYMLQKKNHNKAISKNKINKAISPWDKRQQENLNKSPGAGSLRNANKEYNHEKANLTARSRYLTDEKNCTALSFNNYIKNGNNAELSVASKKTIELREKSKAAKAKQKFAEFPKFARFYSNAQANAALPRNANKFNPISRVVLSKNSVDEIMKNKGNFNEDTSKPHTDRILPNGYLIGNDTNSFAPVTDPQNNIPTLHIAETHTKKFTYKNLSKLLSKDDLKTLKQQSTQNRLNKILSNIKTTISQKETKLRKKILSDAKKTETLNLTERQALSNSKFDPTSYNKIFPVLPAKKIVNDAILDLAGDLRINALECQNYSTINNINISAITNNNENIKPGFKLESQNLSKRDYDYSPNSTCARLFTKKSGMKIDEPIDLFDHNKNELNRSNHMLLQVSGVPTENDNHLNKRVINTFIKNMRRAKYSKGLILKKMVKKKVEKNDQLGPCEPPKLYIDRITATAYKKLGNSIDSWQAPGNNHSSTSTLEAHQHFDVSKLCE